LEPHAHIVSEAAAAWQTPRYLKRTIVSVGVACDTVERACHAVNPCVTSQKLLYLKRDTRRRLGNETDGFARPARACTSAINIWIRAILAPRAASVFRDASLVTDKVSLFERFSRASSAGRRSSGENPYQKAI
jgi:hypothetical protein